MQNDPSGIVFFVVPTVRISGGNLEALRLAGDLRSRGIDARVLSLWKHPNSVERIDAPGVPDVPIVYLSQLAPRKAAVPFELAAQMARYWWRLRKARRSTANKGPAVVLTHYSTFPFAWFTPPEQRYCFLQDEEWMFLSKGPRRQVLRKFILFTCSHCKVITANAYITERARAAGLAPLGEASIWASQSFDVRPPEQERTIDVVMMLRNGRIKRLDLYLRLLAAFKRSGRTSCAVITCEDDIAAEVSRISDVCLLRPNSEEMRALFQRSRIFVLLSEREGFGLPPLEAMGSGCVPLCRDSGGVRCYMTGALAENLIPLEAPLGRILQRIRDLLADRERLSILSAEARKIFAEGTTESAGKRKEALSRLSLSLRR